MPSNYMYLHCSKPHTQWRHCSSNGEREMIVSGKRWIKMCHILKHYSAGGEDIIGLLAL